ncbi:MAG: DUF6250 domain-containing protein [Rhodocyclaceae bacterium]
MQHTQARLRTLTLSTLLITTLSLTACGSNDDDTAETTTPQPTILATDTFTQGLSNWKIEQQDTTGTVSAANGVLDIVQPSGATLWFKQKFSGNYEIRFTATPIPITVSGFTDRISDLNVFWNATVPSGTAPDPTKQTYDGALNSYNPLHLYYVGFGANSNQTTRLRRNDGTDARPQITGYATASAASADDKAGPMTAATSLAANTPVKVRIVSRAASADDPATLKWYANDVLIFSYADTAPYTEGWFALRTTTSHFQIRDFSVVRL